LKENDRTSKTNVRGYIDRKGLKYLWPEKICNKSGRGKERIIRMI